MTKSTKADPVEVTLRDVRLMYSHIYTPQQPKKDAAAGSKPSYNGSFLIDKTTVAGKKLIAECKAALKAAAEKKWPGNIPKLKPEKLALRDGDNEDYDGYADHMYVSAGNRKQPAIVDRRREPVQEDEDQAPYSGCYVNAVVRFWGQDNENGKRINAALEAVQFFRKGERMGIAPVNVDDKFEAFGDDDDDDGEVKTKPKKKAVVVDEDEDDDFFG